MMLQFDDAAVHATLLINRPRTKMSMAAIALDSWKYKYYFEFISLKSKNILVCCALCAGNQMFSTVTLSF